MCLKTLLIHPVMRKESQAEYYHESPWPFFHITRTITITDSTPEQFFSQTLRQQFAAKLSTWGRIYKLSDKATGSKRSPKAMSRRFPRGPCSGPERTRKTPMIQAHAVSLRKLPYSGSSSGSFSTRRISSAWSVKATARSLIDA